jgi:cytosine/adenosine deaminase-related metal-dependent hydrolase
MAPVRDPAKNLVYYAAMEDLDTVIIDGTVVVEDGTVWTWPHDRGHRWEEISPPPSYGFQGQENQC